MRIRELLAREETSLEQINLEDIIPVETGNKIDLMSLFTALGGIQTEFKQMNRLEKNRLDTFKDYFDKEEKSKQQLLETVDTLVSKVGFSEQKPILLSIIEIKDFIESFHRALLLVFTGQGVLRSMINTMTNKQAFYYVEENVSNIQKKIDQLLERVGVYPITSTNETFDPSLMMAVETLNDKGKANLLVIETLEKGYLIQDKILRLAKVRVNKTGMVE